MSTSTPDTDPARPAAPAAAGRGRVRPLAGLVATTTAGLAGLAVVALRDPGVAGHYPTCPFLALTGWYCPGCGTLRGLHALAHGDVVAAVAFNPLMVTLLPLAVALYLAWARRVVTGRGRTFVAPAWTIWALLALVLAFWLLRNLPIGAWAAPH